MADTEKDAATIALATVRDISIEAAREIMSLPILDDKQLIGRVH